MRINNIFFLSFMFLAIVLDANEPKFQKSQEDELHEMVRHYAGSSNQSFDNIKRLILASTSKHKLADNLSSIDEIIQNNKKNKEEKLADLYVDIKSTFELLKQKMNIPAQVDLVYCDISILIGLHVCLMSYQPFDRTVYMYPSFFDKSPTSQLFFMAHELSHVQQHMNLGILDFYLDRPNNRFGAQLEQDADTNAASIIKCPLCLKVILAYKLAAESSYTAEENDSFNKQQGYLTSDDLKNHLKQKSLLDLCKVHKNIENPDIWSGLDTQQGLKEIKQEDYKGSICDRLSDYKNYNKSFYNRPVWDATEN